MCGILALFLADSSLHVNQLLFDGLTALQHRGQDAAGIVTCANNRLYLRKDAGLVKDVFQQEHMLNLRGNIGIGHLRYPTAGTTSSAEAQPFYTNSPYGVALAHNGNLINSAELKKTLNSRMRHVNTDSDSELLMNVFADGLVSVAQPVSDDGLTSPDAVFRAVRAVHQHCKGAYAVVALIPGQGIVGFRDPYGIRPLCFGARESTSAGGQDFAIASESVAIDMVGFTLQRDVEPGEAVFLDRNGKLHTRQCAVEPLPPKSPCVFEYVYLARPDSILDGVSVYQSRLAMGRKLAAKVLREHPDNDIDVVIPIPDTSRTSALELAHALGKPYREGFVKNRYIARTFIMPGQATRVKTVRLKLNSMASEFAGKNVLLVDDSIVRGTTSLQLVQMARAAGARKVYFSSAAPAIRHPNIYGIDMPTTKELVAAGRSAQQVADKIGADWLVYQDLSDLEASIREIKPSLSRFDSSCFSGEYVTGVDTQYLKDIAEERDDANMAARDHTNGGSPGERPCKAPRLVAAANNESIDLHNAPASPSRRRINSDLTGGM